MNGVRVQRSPASTLAAAGVPVSSTTSTGPGNPRSSISPYGLAIDALGETLDLHRRHQHLDATGVVAQTRGHVDGRADVVVALEQQGVTGGDAGPQRERRAHVGGALFELERERERVGLLDADDHAAVAEPLGDAHAAFGRHLADDRAERAEDPPGRVVAEGSGVVREPGQVDEDERAGDTHGCMLYGRGRVMSWTIRTTFDACHRFVMAARGSRTRGGTARSRASSSTPTRLFDELTDELLYHGDVNAALRRMMQEGMRDRNGEQLQGLRELLEQLRQERQDRLDRHDLGGVYDEIAAELDDIVDEERHADRQRPTRRAELSGDERRAQNARGRGRRSQLAPRPAARRPRRQGPRAARPTTSSRPRPSSASSS